MNKDYTIGLDIGTNSVGWAVMYDNLKIPTKRMKVEGNTDKQLIRKNLLGAFLFDSGETAEETRLKRNTRRRINRRKNRLKYLQEIFEIEILKVDNGFFHRLNESFYVEEDKKLERHPIFGNIEDELDYHEKYPTIYHLRKELIDNPEKKDIRLIYLAISHIIKYRGHFLIEGKIDAQNSDIQELFNQFILMYDEVTGNHLSEMSVNVEGVLSEKISKTAKYKKVLDLYKNEKSTGLFSEFLKLMVGNKANFKKHFSLDEDAKIQMNEDKFDENLEHLQNVLDDEYIELILLAQKVNDAITLSGILKYDDKMTNAPLSASMVTRYDNHKKDLTKLKAFVRANFTKEKYNEVFNDSNKNGYAGYIDGGKSQAEFYKYVDKLLKDTTSSKVTKEIQDKINREDYLRKQRTFDNGSIPHQIHGQELTSIINNQSKHYSFFKELGEKIEQIFSFRIPYYIGPLARGNSEFAWLSRITDDKIRPWNFDEIVDKEKSASEFITRMTVNDLYMPDEKTLPSNSLLYQQYTIFNELTKMKYVDESGATSFLDKDTKLAIFKNVFKQRRKVTKKQVIDYLNREYAEFRIVDLKGLNDDTNEFNASYSVYHDLSKALSDKTMLDKDEYFEIFEEIIFILTVFEDKKITSKKLEKYADIFDEKTLKKLARKQFTGWGRLSKKTLDGIEDVDSQKTILDYLKDDGFANRNFMQLINDDQLSFKKIIEEAQLKDKKEDSLLDTIKELPGSPAIKKGIHQSIKIVDELQKVMGYRPKNVVIEMARENQTTDRGRQNSKKRKSKIEEGLKELGSDLLKKEPVENENLLKEKLYLYYLQNGKDMYTDTELDIHRLSEYDVDHIIPQSFIKDDSIDNKVLVLSDINRGKTDNVPSIEVVKQMKARWKTLLKSNLISQRKFDNLTKDERGGLTEQDKAKFIKRQLVETRQITKHVAQLLDQRLNSEFHNKESEERQVKIVTLKSSLTSQFREKFDLYKIREMNNYHHAHDAYLNAVVAKTLMAKYPKLRPEFVYGEFFKENGFQARMKATDKVLFYSNIMKFFNRNEISVDENGEIIWNPGIHLPKIKKVLFKSQVNIVRKVEEQTGMLTKETINPHSESNSLIPVKNGLDTRKYGGFIEAKNAYSILVYAKSVIQNNKEKKIKGNKELLGISKLDKNEFEKNPVRYLERKGYREIDKSKIIKLPKYSLFEFDEGTRRYLVTVKVSNKTGGELQKGNEILLNKDKVEMLKQAKDVRNKRLIHNNFYDDNKEVIHEYLKQIEDFQNKFIQADKNIEKINKLADKINQFDSEIVAESLINILSLTSAGAPAKFKFLGDDIDRKRYTSPQKLLNSTLINQSITGLYETRTDLRRL